MNGYELVRLQPNQVLKTGDTMTGNLTATGNAKFVGNLQGNATTATKLQAAKTINGTPFDGSQNITTTQWGESRTIKIGNAGKPVNGGGDVTWTLKEIGAATSDHTHTPFTRTANGFVPQPGAGTTTRYLREDGTWQIPTGVGTFLQLTGGTLTGDITINKNTPAIHLTPDNAAKPRAKVVAHENGTVYYQAGKSMTDNAGDLALTGYNGTNLNSLAVRANESSFNGNLSVSKEITTKAIAMDSPANTPPNTLLKDTTTMIRNAGIEGTPGQYFMIRNFGTTHSNNANMQMAWNYGGTTKLRYRIQNANTKNWTDWGNIYSDINKPTATEIGALPLTGGTINGTLQVTGALQVAGAPVVQSGSNANGQWIKYYDGTLVCWHQRGFGVSPFTTKAADYLFSSPDSRQDFTFPHAFVSAPMIVVNAGSTGHLTASANAHTPTSFIYRVYSTYSTTIQGGMSGYVAIGRWK